MSLTRFCLVRHGETEWNAVGRIQGTTDIDLNDRGRWQASMVAQALADAGITAIYSSDLKRAANTAKIIAEQLALEPRPVPQLRERNYGLFEGMSYEEARRLHPEAYACYERRDRYYNYESGESLENVQARAAGVMENLLAAHRGETVAIVLHGGVMDAIYRFATGLALEDKRYFAIPNAGLNWLVHDGQGWRVESWADTQHLEKPDLD